MTLVTYQEEQHVTGNGHVEWLELVDGSKGCDFYQSVGVPGVVERVPGLQELRLFPTLSPPEALLDPCLCDQTNQRHQGSQDQGSGGN